MNIHLHNSSEEKDNDYKLLIKDKEDKTEWNNVTPYNLTNDIQSFDLGIIKKFFYKYK